MLVYRDHIYRFRRDCEGDARDLLVGNEVAGDFVLPEGGPVGRLA